LPGVKKTEDDTDNDNNDGDDDDDNEEDDVDDIQYFNQLLTYIYLYSPVCTHLIFQQFCKSNTCIK